MSKVPNANYDKVINALRKDGLWFASEVAI